MFRRSGSAHDACTMAAIQDRRRGRRMEPRSQLVCRERLFMSSMGVQGHNERCATQHEPDAGMRMSVDTAFVTFGQTKEPFGIEVVSGQILIIAACKEPFGERAHDLRHLDAYRLFAGFEARRKRREGPLARIGGIVRGVEQGVDFVEHLDLSSDFGEWITNELKAAFYTTDEG